MNVITSPQPNPPYVWKCKRTAGEQLLPHPTPHHPMYVQVQEQWQHERYYPTPPHPTISYQAFQKRTNRWFGFQPVRTTI